MEAAGVEPALTVRLYPAFAFWLRATSYYLPAVSLPCPLPARGVAAALLFTDSGRIHPPFR